MDNFRHHRRGFSLVEVLVVIGIIVVLISILLPAFSRARYQAQVTTCMARLQQFSVAVNNYALDNKGYFPRQDLPLTGQNLLDVSNDFYKIFREDYKLPHLMFFCPLSPEDIIETGYKQYGYFTLIGYSVWIPRKNGGTQSPPELGTPGVTALDPMPYRGPIKLGDKYANDNPIITDLVISEVGANPTWTSDASRNKQLKFHPWSRHQYKPQLIDSMNAGYADGHVERKPGNELHPRFVGNYWNWR